MESFSNRVPALLKHSFAAQRDEQIRAKSKWRDGAELHACPRLSPQRPRRCATVLKRP